MGKLPFEKKELELYTKNKAKTSSKFGKNPKDRTIEELYNYGIINVDKNSGPTSHQVSAYVKDIFGLKKAGHSGTLDPKVTGVLPVALGRSTKILQSLLKAGKEYVCLMHIHKELPEEKIKKTIMSFVGKMAQLPPVKSAVKRRLRTREIYYIDIHEINNREVLFTVGCEAGTYIRKLCHDIGEKLKVGAHMAELRRTKVGPFNESTCYPVLEIRDNFEFYKENKPNKLKEIIQPIENAVTHLPKVWVMDSAIKSICNGQDIAIPGIVKFNNFEKDQLIAIMSLKDELIGLGKVLMDYHQIRNNNKGIAIKTEKIIMPVETYP